MRGPSPHAPLHSPFQKSLVRFNFFACAHYS